MTSPDSLRYETALEKFFSHLPEEGVVLELNSGNAQYSKKIKDKGYELVVAEIEPASMQLPNPLAKETFFQPINNLLFPYKSFVGIWAHQSFIPYEEDQLKEYFSHMVDWLEQGGIFSLSFIEGEGKKDLYQQMPYGKEKKTVVYYQPDQLAILLESVGFEIIDAWREVSKADQQILQILCKA